MIDKLTKEKVNEMEDEEIVYWYTYIQQKEQTKKMRKELLNYLDIQEAERG